MADVDRRLRSLAGDYPFPATPDVAEAVVRRLRARPARRRRILAVALAAAALVAATLAVSPRARSAVLDLLDSIPGVHIERSSRLPAVRFNYGPPFGERVTLETARRLVDYPIQLPRGVDDPDLVYVWSYSIPGSVVTAVYGNERRARLVFSQWQVSGSDLFFKVLGPGSEATRVSVGGAPGIWLFGSHHVVFFKGKEGLEHRTIGALAGNTLVWQRGGMSYRLEAEVPLSRALDLAESVPRS